MKQLWPILCSLEYLLKRWPVFFLALFCFLFLQWYLKNRNRVLVHWPILEEIPSLLQNAHRIHDWSVELANAVGKTVAVKGPLFGRLHLVYTCDPRNVDYIVKTNFSNFPKGDAYVELFDVLGKGIFTVDFQEWHAQRRMANTMFQSKDFRSLIANMSQIVVKDSLIPLLAHVAKQSSIIDMEDVCLRFSFDSIFTVIFGKNPNYLSIGLPDNELARAIDGATEGLFYRHVMPKTWWKFCRWLMIGKEKLLNESWKIIDRHLAEHILSKRENLHRGVKETDMIASYMIAQEEDKNDFIPKGDGFLRDTGLSFLFAGRDSTGISLAWFFWLVAKTPRVEAKILEELKLVYLNNTKHEETTSDVKMPCVFNSKDLKGLVYLHAALCEALRLYPALPVNHKGVHSNDVLPDGTVVKPGMKILISMYAMGRMEWLWGKDCMEFMPERWIDENGKLNPVPLSKFYTFNAGPRNCLGRDMAFTQMKLVTAAVLFNFHVELVEGHIVRPKPSAVLHMQNGLKVRVKERVAA